MIKAGSPPHTWRKHPAIIFEIYAIRITSTYVEKTWFIYQPCDESKDHLHIRGENAGTLIIAVVGSGSPPHTWRKQPETSKLSPPCGITSTYVEKTVGMAQSRCNAQDHLHIRGENFVMNVYFIMPLGSPPHTWRKLGAYQSIDWNDRITSTYVEKTICFIILTTPSEDHLHIRGENKTWRKI